MITDSSPILLLPTGVAQLTTMVATLRQQGLSEVGAKVLSVLPRPHPAMEKALGLCCAHWRMSYVGNFSTPVRSYRLALDSLPPDEIVGWNRDPAEFVSNRLLAMMPELKGLCRHVTVTQARPNMIGDFYVLSALNPARVILVADGANLGVQIRRHAGLQWRGFNRDLADFPTRSEIWCPAPLARNIAEIGVARVLPPDGLARVYAELAESSLGKHFVGQVLSLGTAPRALILSEHVALMGLCSVQEEFNYHASTVRELASRGLLPILFKRHPREPLETTERLRTAGILKADEIIVTDDLASCVPIECLAPLWAGKKLTALSSYSTALIALRELPGVDCACPDSEHLPPAFRKPILDYCAKHQMPRWELADVPYFASAEQERKRQLCQLLGAAPDIQRTCQHQDRGQFARPALERGHQGHTNPSTPIVRSVGYKVSHVLFVSHEASRTGAPICLLHLLRWIRANTKTSFEILLVKGGPLEPEFARLGKVHSPAALMREAPDLQRFDLIYSNTACNGLLLERMPYGQVPIITHVHELDGGIDCIGARGIAGMIRHSSHYIACASGVAAMLQRRFNIPAERISVHHEMVQLAPTLDGAACGDVPALRARFGIPDDAWILAACGTADWRKAADIFVQLAGHVRRRGDPNRPMRFLWIGRLADQAMATVLRHDIRRAGLGNEVLFVGEQQNPHELLSICDVFCLTSREDPFPLVMLEAAALAKPVVCFDLAGGAPEFCLHGGGVAVPFLDVPAMADTCIELLSNPERRTEIGCKGRESVRARFAVESIAPGLWEQVERFLAHPPSLPEGRQRDHGFAEIVRTWSLDEAPQRDYIKLYLARHAVFAEARRLARQGQVANALTLVLGTVRTAMEAKDRLALTETLAEASEELAVLDPAKARFFLQQAERSAAVGGAQIVFSEKSTKGAAEIPRHVAVVPLERSV